MSYIISLTASLERIEAYTNLKFGEGTYLPYYLNNGYDENYFYYINNSSKTISFANWGLSTDHIDFLPEELGITNPNLIDQHLMAEGFEMFKYANFGENGLVIADGVVINFRENGKIIPYFCYIPDTNEPTGKKIFTIAAKMDVEYPVRYYECDIRLTKANDFFRKIDNQYHLSPLILSRDLEKIWLRGNLNKQTYKEIIDNGFTKEEFKAYPISPDIYSQGLDINKEEMLRPIDISTL